LREDCDIDKAVFDEISHHAYVITKERKFLQIAICKKTRDILSIETKNLADDVLPEQEIVNMILHRFNNRVILVLKDGSLSQISLEKFEVPTF
jgi:hypothetical protein